MHIVHYVGERFRDPTTLLTPPYVVCALAITLTALMAGGLGFREAWKAVFSAPHWQSRGTRADLVMSLAQILIFDLPMESAQLGMLGAVYLLVHGAGPAPWTWQLAPGLEAALAAAVTVLSYDAATFAAHALSHRVPLLWRFHSVHHSATALSLFTLYRDHPLDHLVRSALRGAFMGAALALLHAFLPRATPGATVLGLGAGFLVYLPFIHLHHSHLPVRLPRALRLFLLSPHLHQLHHSRDERHAGRNLGVIFPFWDRLFGTYLDEPFERGALEFGLAGGDPYRDSLLRCYLKPFALVFQRDP